MASHDNLVLIINQLLQGLDKMGDSLSVVKAIKEDVENIKRRVDKMEERIGDELPTKSDIFAIMGMLDVKLTPLDQMRLMEERLLKVEATVPHLRRTETTAVDSTLINSTLQEVRKSSDRIKSMEERQTILENSIAKMDGNMSIVMQSLNSLENTIKTMNKKLDTVKENKTNIEKMLKVMNDANNNLEDVEKSVKRLETVGKSLNKLETMEVKINKLESMEKNLNKLKNIEINKNKLEAVENSVNKLVATSHNGVARQFDATVKGKNIALSKDFKSATRFTGKASPGCAGVISNSMLKEDEVFDIIIEKTMNEFTGAGISIGVINVKSDKIKETLNIFRRYLRYHNRFPLSRMFRITGTWCIFSRRDTESGRSIAFRDEHWVNEKYPLDTRNLKVGSVLGVSRRRNGDLHFYLDRVDCGPALKDVPKKVYAFVEVLNYVTEIRIYT